MSKNILEEIIKKKIEKIDNLKKSTSLNSLTDIINKNNSFLNFKQKIQSNLLNNKISIYSIFFLIISLRIFLDILYFF